MCLATAPPSPRCFHCHPVAFYGTRNHSTARLGGRSVCRRGTAAPRAPSCVIAFEPLTEDLLRPAGAGKGLEQDQRAHGQCHHAVVGDCLRCPPCQSRERPPPLEQAEYCFVRVLPDGWNPVKVQQPFRLLGRVLGWYAVLCRVGTKISSNCMARMDAARLPHRSAYKADQGRQESSGRPAPASHCRAPGNQRAAILLTTLLQSSSSSPPRFFLGPRSRYGVFGSHPRG